MNLKTAVGIVKVAAFAQVNVISGAVELLHPAALDSTSEPNSTAVFRVKEPEEATESIPLWRDLILATWGADPLQRPCCKGTMRRIEPNFHCQDTHHSNESRWKPKEIPLGDGRTIVLNAD
ncbi:MAG: hypothetical protein ACOYMN_18340 [Roseimicrobium sp.]